MSLFIAFDGPNGSGKSTLVKEIKKRLENDNYRVTLTSEPTQTRIGSFVRKISESVNGIGLACLVAADRYIHIQNVIKPALLADEIVLCDRYLASTLVLQQMDGVDKKFLLNLNSKIEKPDIYFILNSTPEILTTRLQNRGLELTRFENEKQKQEIESRMFKEIINELKGLDINTYEIDTSEPVSTYCDYVYNVIIRQLQEEG